MTRASEMDGAIDRYERREDSRDPVRTDVWVSGVGTSGIEARAERESCRPRSMNAAVGFATGSEEIKRVGVRDLSGIGPLPWSRSSVSGNFPACRLGGRIC